MTELILILYSWQFYEQNKTTLDIYFLFKIFFLLFHHFNTSNQTMFFVSRAE